MRRVFRAETDRVGFCGLGSVKSNIGHLDAAAGIAGLIKLALSFRHRSLPPSIHVERPNPDLAIDTSPFRVVDRPTAWDAGTRRAGLSSFGMGGANVHLVLEEAPPAPDPAADRPGHLLVLSAPHARRPWRGCAAGWRTISRRRRRISWPMSRRPCSPGASPSPIGGPRPATAAMPRSAARSMDSASAAAGPEAPGVVFMFPGQGATPGNGGGALPPLSRPSGRRSMPLHGRAAVRRRYPRGSSRRSRR